VKAKTPVPGLIDLRKFVRTDKPHISNSYLSTLKRALIGEPQWFGTEAFLNFGTEHHKRALEPKELTVRLDKNDELCTGMAGSFRANPEVKKILRGATCEKEYNRVYRGARVLLFVDIEKPLRGWDLKGTSCENERQFIKASREYDYFRQASLYMEVCGYKEFTFIGQRKKPVEVEEGYPGSYWSGLSWVTHPLFFLPVNDFPVYMKEGKEELHLLIDTHLQLRRFYEKEKSR
jgi:hypothetical protein